MRLGSRTRYPWFCISFLCFIPPHGLRVIRLNLDFTLRKWLNRYHSEMRYSAFMNYTMNKNITVDRRIILQDVGFGFMPWRWADIRNERLLQQLTVLQIWNWQQQLIFYSCSWKETANKQTVMKISEMGNLLEKFRNGFRTCSVSWEI